MARNNVGADTLRASVTVDVPPPEAPEPAPVTAEARRSDEATDPPPTVTSPTPSSRVTVSRAAIFGACGVAVEQGGYTWVVQSDLWDARARDRMLVYRLRGFRSDVYVDTSGRGRPAYRIVIGQFKTRAEAQVARRWLPADATAPWLLNLDDAPVFSAREE